MNRLKTPVKPPAPFKIQSKAAFKAASPVVQTKIAVKVPAPFAMQAAIANRLPLQAQAHVAQPRFATSGLPRQRSLPAVPPVFRASAPALTTITPGALQGQRERKASQVLLPAPVARGVAMRAPLPAARGLAIQRSQAAVAPVARGRVLTIASLGGEGQLSETGKFFIPKSYGGQLIYGTAQPGSSTQYKGEKPAVFDGKTYIPYISASNAPTKKFVRDCLHTAEEINTGQTLKQGGVSSKVLGTAVVFGDADAANIAAAKGHASDNAAAPGLGNAYVMVNTGWVDKKGADSPYHAAAVVAVDGDDRVTLEVFATGIDGRRTVQSATYRMYSVSAGGHKQFHQYWLDSYFRTDASTIVIEPK